MPYQDIFFEILGIREIMVSLYFHLLNINLSHPKTHSKGMTVISHLHN